MPEVKSLHFPKDEALDSRLPVLLRQVLIVSFKFQMVN